MKIILRSYTVLATLCGFLALFTLLVSAIAGKKKIIRVCAAVLLVVSLSVFILGQIYVEVPYVQEITVQEAMSRLTESGLKGVLPDGVDLTEATLKKIVSAQGIKEDTPVIRGTEVILYFEQFAIVPDVINLQYSTARTILEKTCLLPEIDSASVTIGAIIDNATVVAISPGVGTTVPLGTIVTVTLKLTPPNMITVPDLRGMKETDAKELLKSLGLDSFTYWNSAFNHDEGVFFVFSQRTAAGSLVELGTTIEVEISPRQYGTTTQMPDLIGKNCADATAELVAAGLTSSNLFITDGIEAADGPIEYFIIEQNYAPGAELTVGDNVELLFAPKFQTAEQ